MIRRGAIIGFGQVAEHGHWPAYAASPSFEITTIVDPSAERRDAARRLDPRVAAVASLDEVRAGEVDFVDVCTPPSLHGELMLAALERGWHVLCEKPFVLDLATFGAVRAAAVRADRAVVPIHNWKYAPIVRRATTLLREGIVGELRHVGIETLRQHACASSDPDDRNWRRDPAIAGGGILMDHGWHAVYLAMHWFGARPSAVGATLHRSAPDAAEDEARIVMRFDRGDAEIFLSWNAGVRRNAMVLSGDAGELVVADGVLEVRASGAEGRVDFAQALSAGSHHADWFSDLLPDVGRAFEGPASSRPMLDEAGATLTTIQHAYDAAARLAPANP